MGMVSFISTGNEPVTKEMLGELEALKDRPIDFSDIPEMTDEELAAVKRQIDEGRRNREMFSLRLHSGTAEWWRKNIGAGYTTVMAKLLDTARKHPEWIKEAVKAH